MENEFWVSEVTNYIEKEAVEWKRIKECKDDYVDPVKVFKIGSPAKYYNTYKRYRTFSIERGDKKDEIFE